MGNASSTDTLERACPVGYVHLSGSKDKSEPRVFGVILGRMVAQARPVYVPTLSVLLGHPSTDQFWDRHPVSGRLGKVLGLETLIGWRARILQALYELDTPEAVDAVREVAEARDKIGPSVTVLNEMKRRCPGEQLVQFEARALASERLIALGLLEDKVLLRQGRDDPTEPVFFRLWCSCMLQGTTPWLGTRD